MTTRKPSSAKPKAGRKPRDTKHVAIYARFGWVGVKSADLHWWSPDEARRIARQIIDRADWLDAQPSRVRR